VVWHILTKLVNEDIDVDNFERYLSSVALVIGKYGGPT
jgi:hypothetical protein